MKLITTVQDGIEYANRLGLGGSYRGAGWIPGTQERLCVENGRDIYDSLVRRLGLA